MPGWVASSYLSRALVCASTLLGIATGCSNVAYDSGPDAGTWPTALCATQAEPTPLWILCTNPDLKGASLDGLPINGTVTGVVTAWQTGFDGCLASLVPVGVNGSDAHLLRLRAADGSDFELGIVVPDLAVDLQVGDNVSVGYGAMSGLFSPIASRIEVSKNDRLIIYLGNGSDPAGMTLPAGVSLTLGSQLCATQDQCGSWGRYELTVDVSGTRVTMPPGGRAQVGGYRVRVGESAQATGFTGTCADWFVSRTTLLLTPALPTGT